MESANVEEVSNRSDANLADIVYQLSVNFLLYVVLIIVFYMLTRFYLEEETSTDLDGYTMVSTSDDADHDLHQVIENESAKQHQSDANPNIKNKEFSTASKKPSSFLNINEWGEPEGTKQEVVQRAVVCAAGLIISFSVWGLVQERMLTQTYDGDFFKYSYGLVFITRLGGLLTSALLMYFMQVEWYTSRLWEYSFPSVANMLSSWCQYEALQYVSFPAVMLAKAFKMVPVMLMGKFMNNKDYDTYEYVSGAVVGIGLYIFLASSENLTLGENVFGDPENIHGASIGVVLLLFFLFFDSFTGQWQTRMFQLNKSLSPVQMMLITNAFSATFSFITLVHQEELSLSMSFVVDHPKMILHITIFCISTAIGQLFIFYTVKSFGAVVFAIIMSVRILCSTVLSCIVYSHTITELGYVGILIVFGAVAYRIMRKTEGGNLIRWKENQMDKLTSDTFKGWHEHADV